MHLRLLQKEQLKKCRTSLNENSSPQNNLETIINEHDKKCLNISLGHDGTTIKIVTGHF